MQITDYTVALFTNDKEFCVLVDTADAASHGDLRGPFVAAPLMGP